MPMMGANSQPLSYKLSALAIDLNSSKAVAGKELILSSWCIAIHQLDKLNSFPAIAFELFSSMARSLGL